MGDEAKVKIEGDNTGLKKSLTESSKLLNTFAAKHSGQETPTIESPASGLGDFALQSLQIFTALGALEGVKESLIQLKEVMRESISVAAEYEASLAKFETVYNTAGYKAGYAKDQLAALNKELHESTGIPTDDIRDGMSELFKIGQIYGDVFKKTLKVSADFAAFNNQGMVESIKAVGRAVENPARGMYYLSRATYRLTDAEMRRIKALQDSMQIEKARLLLLQIVGRNLEGQAAARKGTLKGMFMEIDEARHEAFKGIGESMSSGLKALGPILTDFIGAVKLLGEAFGTTFSLIAAGIGFLDQAVRELIASINAWIKLIDPILPKYATTREWLAEQKKKFPELRSPEEKRRAAAGEPEPTQGKIEQMPSQKSIEGTFEDIEATWKRISGASAENATVTAIDSQTKTQQASATEQLNATEQTNGLIAMLLESSYGVSPVGALANG